MFFKTRMRRSLRRMIEAASPDGLRPDRRMTHERALTFERAAIAFGATWYGMTPAQAALVIVHAVRTFAGLGSAEAGRLDSAAGQFAARRGLEEFSAAIARDMARADHLAALRRQGHPGTTRPTIHGLAILA